MNVRLTWSPWVSPAWPPCRLTVDIRVLTLSILPRPGAEASLSSTGEWRRMKEAAASPASPPASCHEMRNWIILKQGS